jgi:hypothetical protein
MVYYENNVSVIFVAVRRTTIRNSQQCFYTKHNSQLTLPSFAAHNDVQHFDWSPIAAPADADQVDCGSATVMVCTSRGSGVVSAWHAATKQWRALSTREEGAGDAASCAMSMAACGADGAVWAISQCETKIYRYVVAAADNSNNTGGGGGGVWRRVKGCARRIAVADNDNVVIVDAAGDAYRWAPPKTTSSNSGGGGAWLPLPTEAGGERVRFDSIAIDSTNDVFAVDRRRRAYSLAAADADADGASAVWAHMQCVDTHGGARACITSVFAGAAAVDGGVGGVDAAGRLRQWHTDDTAWVLCGDPNDTVDGARVTWAAAAADGTALVVAVSSSSSSSSSSTKSALFLRPLNRVSAVAWSRLPGRLRTVSVGSRTHLAATGDDADSGDAHAGYVYVVQRHVTPFRFVFALFLLYFLSFC